MNRCASMVLSLLLLGCSVQAATGRVPNFTLADPQGGKHSLPQLAKQGLVLVMTAPTLRDESAQKGWDADLVAARGSNKGALVFVEDMSASLFKGTARSEMHKDWKAGDVPMLLLDEAGNVRTSLGLAKNDTKVFVYNTSGILIYTYAGAPTKAAAQTIWSKLK